MWRTLKEECKAVGRPTEVDEVEQEEVVKRRRVKAGILEKWKQRKSSQLTSEEIAQRRRGCCISRIGFRR